MSKTFLRPNSYSEGLKPSPYSAPEGPCTVANRTLLSDVSPYFTSLYSSHNKIILALVRTDGWCLTSACVTGAKRLRRKCSSSTHKHAPLNLGELVFNSPQHLYRSLLPLLLLPCCVFSCLQLIGFSSRLSGNCLCVWCCTGLTLQASKRIRLQLLLLHKLLSE